MNETKKKKKKMDYFREDIQKSEGEGKKKITARIHTIMLSFL